MHEVIHAWRTPTYQDEKDTQEHHCAIKGDDLPVAFLIKSQITI
jgi:hypothetical protein